MKSFGSRGLAATAVAMVALAVAVGTSGAATRTTKNYDTSTLAGKVASVNGTSGLAVRFSGFVEQEAAVDGFEPLAPDGATLTDGGPAAPSSRRT